VALVAVLAGWMALGPITFERGGTLTVDGTSNVHDWTCTASSFTATAAGEATGSALTSLSALSVTVPAASLDCRNRTMNGKLRDALGATPVTFTLTRGTVGTAQRGRLPVQVAGRLTIHDTARPVTFVAQARPLGNRRFQVTGTVPVTMSQHGVRPPTALAGTMRTGDRVTVGFDVTIVAAP
jgi:polyisoprenoid-binding protein YceI